MLNIITHVHAIAQHFVVVDKTNMHHDAFYNNPLSELIFTLCGHMAPNKHCEYILGLGYIVIEVRHAGLVA